MPIEFSVAAFRLGHAMVRARYNWNTVFDNGGGTLEFLFIFSALGGDLGGDTRLASIWIADFRRLYDFGEANKPNLEVPAAKFNRAMRIDTHDRRPAPAPASGGDRATGQRRIQRPAPQPRVQEPHAGEDAEARHRPADGDLPQEQGREPHQADKRPDPGRQQRRRPERTHAGSAAGAREGHAALVLHPARGGVQRTESSRAWARASWRRRSIGRWRGASTRSCATRPSRRRLGPNSSTFRMVDLLLFAFEGKKALLAPNG